MKSILVTGLCTLHWGRLQYGNIGNYYIVEPLFRQLHKHFEDYRIMTTFQMDECFVQKENIEVLPMEIYYSWCENDVEKAKKDVAVAEKYSRGEQCILTEYGKVLLECEYVIDVSGDMWGDNAEHVGHQRFLVDCLKMKTAQILNCKTILYAVTPGPFSKPEENAIAHEVFEKFNLVLVREKVSLRNLRSWGYSIENVKWAPCPSFLFEPDFSYQSQWTQKIDELHENKEKVVGLTFGGFNMPVGPYDMWPREEEQYTVFLKLVEHLVNDLHVHVILFSHTNGFKLPPDFELINGRDFVILERFYQIIRKHFPKFKENVILINEPLLPCNIKTVISKMDMLITGRVHASVAATSMCVPTVYMEYDRRVIYSDKMTGFSEQIGMEKFVSTPSDYCLLKSDVDRCYEEMDKIREQLGGIIPNIKNLAEEAFEDIKKC